MAVKSVQFDDGVNEHWVLELAGEVDPMKDAHLGADPPAESDSKTEGPFSPTIYEYLWTLEHFGDRTVGSKRIWTGPTNPRGKNVAYADSARIFLLFGNMKDWRTSEPIATVKFMSPAPAGKNRFGRFGKDLQTASKVTGMIPGGGAASKWIEAAADLSAASLPPSEFGWSVSKAAMRDKEKRLSGVVWTIPGPMLKRLNGRLSGGLAVSFERSPQQSDDSASSANKESTAGEAQNTVQLRAEIFVRTIKRERQITPLPTSGYLTLMLDPGST